MMPDLIAPAGPAPPAPPAGWRPWLGRFGRKALDVVYPAHCPACGVGTEAPGALCGPCWQAMAFITRPYCDRLGTPFSLDIGGTLLSPEAIARPPSFDRARAVALHDGAARDFVHRLKFSDRHDLARPMGRLMAGAGRDVLEGADLLLPVPLHWTRLFWRRFNQSVLLAEAVSAAAGVPMLADALARRKRTRTQRGLTRAQRADNLSGAFEVSAARKIAIEGRNIVLIDDVRTTGATLNACAGALRRAGAARIDVVTFTVVADSALVPI